MPKREDERYLGLSGSHPVYCTCVDCTRRFLDRNTGPTWRGIWGRLLSKFRREKPASHPAECGCATCNLLKSLDSEKPDRTQTFSDPR